MGIRGKTRIKNRMREAQRPLEAGGKAPMPPHPEPTPFDFDRSEELCKELAHDEAVVRDRALADTPALVKKLVASGGADLGLEFAKVWKGLFYCMWHSDKALVQLDCADRIAGLAGHVAIDARAEWVGQGWVCLERHWHMIDKWRVDKYYALMRRMLRAHLAGWAADTTRGPLYAAPLLGVYRSEKLGIGTHISDCLVEECIRTNLPHDAFLELVRTVLVPALAHSTGRVQGERIQTRVFDRLAGDVGGAAESDEALEWISEARWEDFHPLVDDAATAQETRTSNRALLVKLSERIERLLEETGEATDLQEMDSDEEMQDMALDAHKRVVLATRDAAPAEAARQSEKRKKRRAQREITKLKKTDNYSEIKRVVRKAAKDGLRLKKPKKQKGRGGLGKALRVADDAGALAKQTKTKKRKRRV